MITTQPYIVVLAQVCTADTNAMVRFLLTAEIELHIILVSLQPHTTHTTGTSVPNKLTMQTEVVPKDQRMHRIFNVFQGHKTLANAVINYE